jgi:hypothetical protein
MRDSYGFEKAHKRTVNCDGKTEDIDQAVIDDAVRRFLSEIHRKGEKKSCRTLRREQAPRMLRLSEGWRKG